MLNIVDLINYLQERRMAALIQLSDCKEDGRMREWAELKGRYHAYGVAIEKAKSLIK